MTENPNPFDEIKAQQAHPYIRERQAALEKIKDLLAKNEQVRTCIEQLQEVIRLSEYLIVADRARQILDDWQTRSQVVHTMHEQQPIFGVVCPKCGHQNYFDKRQVCGSHGIIFLGKAEDQSDELLLECQNPECRKPFVVHVNCEGYQ